MPRSNPGALALIRRLVREEGRRHVRGYVIAFICMGLVAAATAITAYLMKDIVDRVFAERSLTAAYWLAAIIMAVYTVKGLASYGQTVALARITNAIVADNRRRFFARCLDFDLAQLGAQHSSDLVNRFNNGIASIANALNLIITAIGRDFLTLLGLVIVMIVQDPVMSAIAFVIGPVAVIGVRQLIIRARKEAKRNLDFSGTILEVFSEAISGMRVVKAFGLEARFARAMERASESSRTSADKIAIVGARSSPLMETLAGFAIAFVIVYCAWRVLEGGELPGAFFSFITALLLAYEPAKRLARLNIDLNTALTGVAFVFEIIDRPAHEANRATGAPLAIGRGEVAVDRVSFGYRADQRVLDEVSFVAAAGKTTALVGESGSGKSTIIALLLRLHAPDAGRVMVDGQDVGSVSLETLRAAIALVSQDVFLFTGSIRDNIADGRPGATDEEIIAAARAANAHGFIMAQPGGYDTPAGERGARLSGGQRQRIAIARAILKNAPIILLDEATASLDAESEREVQAGLSALSKGRTTIVVAHRLSTIRDADEILVLDRGRIIERGTHAELVSRGGGYAALARLQGVAA